MVASNISIKIIVIKYQYLNTDNIIVTISMNDMILEMFGENGLTLLDREVMRAEHIFKNRDSVSVVDTLARTDTSTTDTLDNTDFDTVTKKAMESAIDDIRLFTEKITELKKERKNIPNTVTVAEKGRLKRDIDNKIDHYNNMIVTIRRMCELADSKDEQERRDLLKLCERYLETKQ